MKQRTVQVSQILDGNLVDIHSHAFFFSFPRLIVADNSVLRAAIYWAQAKYITPVLAARGCTKLIYDLIETILAATDI